MNYFGMPIKVAPPEEIAMAALKASRIQVIGDWVFYFMPDGSVVIDGRMD